MSNCTVVKVHSGVSGRDKAGAQTRQPGRQGERRQQTHLCKCCIYTVYPKKNSPLSRPLLHEARTNCYNCDNRFPLHYNCRFPGEHGLAGFIEATDDGGGEW